MCNKKRQQQQQQQTQQLKPLKQKVFLNVHILQKQKKERKKKRFRFCFLCTKSKYCLLYTQTNNKITENLHIWSLWKEAAHTQNTHKKKMKMIIHFNKTKKVMIE